MIICFTAVEMIFNEHNLAQGYGQFSVIFICCDSLQLPKHYITMKQLLFSIHITFCHHFFRLFVFEFVMIFLICSFHPSLCFLLFFFACREWNFLSIRIPFFYQPPPFFSLSLRHFSSILIHLPSKHARPGRLTQPSSFFALKYFIHQPAQSIHTYRSNKTSCLLAQPEDESVGRRKSNIKFANQAANLTKHRQK